MNKIYFSHPAHILNISTKEVVLYLYERFHLPLSAEDDAYV
jgi:hypothetical protein